MRKIMITLGLLLSWSAMAQQENFIPYEEADRVRQGLAQHYADCGFFPKKLTDLLVTTTKNKRCLNAGGTPPLPPTPENKAAVAKFIYKPSNNRNGGGFQNYDLFVRMFWFP